LETYQKNFPDFIYGSPLSIEVLGQDEKTKARPNGVLQEEQVKIEEPWELRSGVVHEEKVQPKIPQDLRGGG
jgi:hypothetical protein